MNISKALFGATHPGTTVVPLFSSILNSGMFDGWVLNRMLDGQGVPDNAKYFYMWWIAASKGGQFVTIEERAVTEKILLENAQRYSHWVTLPTQLSPGHAFLYLDARLGGIWCNNTDFSQYSPQIILNAISTTWEEKKYPVLNSSDIEQLNKAYLTGTHRGLAGSSWPTVSGIVSGAHEAVKSAGKAISGAVTGAHEKITDIASSAASAVVVKTVDKTLTGVTDSAIKNLQKAGSAGRAEFRKTKSEIGGVFTEMLLQSSIVILGSMIIFYKLT